MEVDVSSHASPEISALPKVEVSACLMRLPYIYMYDRNEAKVKYLVEN